MSYTTRKAFALGRAPRMSTSTASFQPSGTMTIEGAAGYGYGGSLPGGGRGPIGGGKPAGDGGQRGGAAGGGGPKGGGGHGPKGGGGHGPKGGGGWRGVVGPRVGMVKLPGSVIGPSSTYDGGWPSYGGGGTSYDNNWPSYDDGGGTTRSFNARSISPGSANVGPLEPVTKPPTPEEEDDEKEAVAPTAITPAPESNNMLMYAAIGIAALWLFTRK